MTPVTTDSQNRIGLSIPQVLFCTAINPALITGTMLLLLLLIHKNNHQEMSPEDSGMYAASTILMGLPLLACLGLLLARALAPRVSLPAEEMHPTSFAP